MDQCAVLYIKPGGPDEQHTDALRALGFSVDVVDDLPPAEVFTAYHAVVVRVGCATQLPNLAARLRAKPRFGRRVLIALVPGTLTDRQRRDSAASGFDVTLAETVSPRDLAAHILRGLRPFPEFRCVLRSPHGRRKAA